MEYFGADYEPGDVVIVKDKDNKYFLLKVKDVAGTQVIAEVTTFLFMFLFASPINQL